MASTGLTIQPRPVIIGLRSTEVNDEFTNMFSDDDSIGLEMDLNAINKIKQLKSRTLVSTFKLQPITSYSQVSTLTTTLCTNLLQFERPPPFTDKLDFIPTNSAPKRIVNALTEFYNTRDYPEFIRTVGSVSEDNLTASIAIQLKLICAPYDKTIDLSPFVNHDMDPRLSALFHWFYGGTINTQLACAHYLKAAMDFVKTTSYLPISIFFNDFSLDNLLYKYCRALIELFPKHPIVPSVLVRIADITTNPLQIQSLIDQHSAAPDQEDKLDDDSDSFEDLKALKKQRSIIESSMSLIKIAGSSVTNPLEVLAVNANQVVVSMDDAPMPLTYLLEDGSNGMTPDAFSGWIRSFRFQKKDQIEIETIKGIYQQPCPDSSDRNLTEEGVEDLIHRMQSEDIRGSIPEHSSPEMSLLLLPALHFINTYTDEFFGNSAPCSVILQKEFLCHNAFERRDSQALNDALRYFTEKIPQKLPAKDIDLSYQKRKQPAKIHPVDANTELLMNLINVALILELRSPLTLLPASGNVTVESAAVHPVFTRKWRIGTLYHLYSTEEFPPYLAFRAAFALGILVMEAVPQIAVRFFFEGLYTLLNSAPSLARTLWVPASFFAFGEALNDCGKYSYAAQCLDNAIQMSTSNHFFAVKAAKISKKNEDIQRAVFYYSHAISLFLDAQLAGEAVFTSQVLAKIYESCGQNIEGMQLLYYILKDVYQIDNGNKSGSVSKRPRQHIVQSTVRPDAIATIITATILAQLFIKSNQFRKAENLLHEIERYVKNPTILKNINFIREKIDIGRNTFTGYKGSPNEHVISARARSNTVGPGSNQIMDIALPSMKVKAKYYIAKSQPEMAIFWAEQICHFARTTNSAKEHALGFQLRGMAFMCFYDEFFRIPDEFIIDHELNDSEQSFAKFKATKKHTKETLFSEALSSLNYAMICYDRAGNTTKYLETQLSYCEAILYHVMNQTDFKHSSVKEFSFKRPEMETESTSFLRFPMLATNFESITLSSLNIVEHLQGIINSCDKMSSTLMNPIFIIRSQLCQGMFMAFRKKYKAAGTYFDFALSNMRKFFFSGNRFLMRDVGFSLGKQIYQITKVLALFLLTFQAEFINKRLIVFDMYNDMQAFNANQNRMITYEPNIKLNATIRLQTSILKLSNPRFPDFMEVLKENKMSKRIEQRNMITQRWELLTAMKRIKGNIRLFSQNRYDDDEIFDRNRSECKEMENIAEKIRTKTPNAQSTEIPPHSVDTTIIILAFKGKIITYIPATGLKKITRVRIGTEGEFTLEIPSKTFQFSSSVFKSGFLKAVANLIVSEPQIQLKYKFGLHFENECVKLGQLLFGEIPLLSDLEFNLPIPDNHLLGDPRYLSRSKRGVLTTAAINRRPLVVVTSPRLNAIPFELMFPKCTVIRSIGFFKAFRRENCSEDISRFSVMKWRADKDTQFAVSEKRNIEQVQTMLFTLGAGSLPPYYVAEYERSFPFPFPLFDPNRSTDKYLLDYPFCDIIPIKSDAIPDFSNLVNPLFVMTYADLAEWPNFLDKLVEENLKATFLFIPASSIRAAFRELEDIFERHARRSAYFEQNPLDPGAAAYAHLSKNSFQMIATIQRTLMNHLKVPIGLICPNRDFVD